MGEIDYTTATGFNVTVVDVVLVLIALYTTWW